jgi:catechol 2,3-dioxygenase-like lactoylglutathione lyase family enzyme
MNMMLEVIPVPVTDTDRAIEFYEGKLGFVKDMDVRMNENLRFVQLTPPGSNCSIHVGEGTSVMEPGAVKGLILVVDSAEEAKKMLDQKGIKTDDIEEMGWGKHVIFDDPDGNSWTLQESYSRNKKRAEAKDARPVA